MVVADREERLALGAQNRKKKGLRVGQFEYLADSPVEVDCQSRFVLSQPGEMMRRLALKQRKDGARGRRSRPIILVSDRRVDAAAERLRLGVLVSGKQAAEQIA